MRAATSLRSAIHRFATSLLLVPAAYLLAAVLLTVALVPLESAVRGTPIGQIANVARAEDLLPAIGGATLTLAGFVLTMATLSIQFGASTYAPRLVERLRRDPVLQHTIGVALGTFLFCFLVLLLVRPSSQATAAAAVAVALLGAVAAVLLFVALLDRLTGALRPGETLQSIAQRALVLIPNVYPDRTTKAPDVAGEDGLPDLARVAWDRLPATGVVWRTAALGTVVDVEFHKLVDRAASHGAEIQLTLPVGAFLQEHDAVAVVQREDGSPDAALAEALRDPICRAIVVSQERTVDADPAYAIRLIVDIALRALSPGVNDPTTAAQAIDHLGQLLVTLSGRRLGPRELCDETGTTRVVVPAPGWEALVALAFDEVIEVTTATRVRDHLRVVATDVIARVPDARRPALQRRADVLDGPTRSSGAL